MAMFRQHYVMRPVRNRSPSPGCRQAKRWQKWIWPPDRKGAVGRRPQYDFHADRRRAFSVGIQMQACGSCIRSREHTIVGKFLSYEKATAGNDRAGKSGDFRQGSRIQ